MWPFNKKKLSPLEQCRKAMKGLTKNEKQFNITQLLKDDFPFMHIHHDPRRKYSDKDFNLWSSAGKR
jgi:hypothetical protein